LVLLDLNVKSARHLLGEFRALGRLLVALNDDADQRVGALEAGCVDALPHSLEPDELALKVLRLARVDRAQPPGGTIVAGPLTVDLSSCGLLWKGRELAVSPLLLELAAYLATRTGQRTNAPS
jgi:DNA-binding response OmpR family regulator